GLPAALHHQASVGQRVALTDPWREFSAEKQAVNPPTERGQKYASHKLGGQSGEAGGDAANRRPYLADHRLGQLRRRQSGDGLTRQLPVRRRRNLLTQIMDHDWEYL